MLSRDLARLTHPGHLTNPLVKRISMISNQHFPESLQHGGCGGCSISAVMARKCCVSQCLGSRFPTRVRYGQHHTPGMFTDTVGERVGAMETTARNSNATTRLQYVFLSLLFQFTVNFIPALRNHHSFPLFISKWSHIFHSRKG